MKNHILKGPQFSTYEEALQFGLRYYETSIVVEIAGTIYSKVPSHFRACIKKDAAPTTPLEPRQYDEVEKRGKPPS